MKGRRYCPESPTGAHRAYYSARQSPEGTRATCRDCTVEVWKGVDGAWYEPILPAWFVWGLAFVIVAAILSTIFATWFVR